MLIRPTITIRIPFRRYFCANSALLPNVTQEIKSASCSPSRLYLRFTANVYLAIAISLSLPAYLISGFFVSLPIKITLFIIFVLSAAKLPYNHHSVPSMHWFPVVWFHHQAKTIRRYGNISSNTVLPSLFFPAYYIT